MGITTARGTSDLGVISQVILGIACFILSLAYLGRTSGNGGDPTVDVGYAMFFALIGVVFGINSAIVGSRD